MNLLRLWISVLFRKDRFIFTVTRDLSVSWEVTLNMFKWRAVTETSFNLYITQVNVINLSQNVALLQNLVNYVTACYERSQWKSGYAAFSNTSLEV